MKTFAIIPVKRFEKGKSRLGSFLNVQQRVNLSKLLLERTMKTLKTSSRIHKIVIVSADKRTAQIAEKYGAKFLKEYTDSGVNSAVSLADKYSHSTGADATIVVPVDLPLALPEDIDIACALAQSEKKCMVICPSYRYDGSNILLRKPGSLMKTYYDANSYPMHVLAALKKNANIKVLFINRLMMDIDTVEDVDDLVMNYRSDDRILSYLQRRMKKMNIYKPRYF